MNMEDKVYIMNLNTFVFVNSVLFTMFPEFVMMVLGDVSRDTSPITRQGVNE